MIVPALIILGGIGLLLRKKKPGSIALPPGQPPEKINAELWAQTNFKVEVYGGDKFRTPPPPTPDSVTASPSCDVIAVGDGWWKIAMEHAQKLVDAGARSPSDVAQKIVADMMPSCSSKSTPGLNDLRDEIADRIAWSFPRVPKPIDWDEPARNWVPQTIKIPSICGSLICPPGWTCSQTSMSDTCVMPSAQVPQLMARGKRGGNLRRILATPRNMVVM